MYLNGRKMGFSQTVVTPAKYRGNSGFKITSTSVARMELLGNKVSQDSSSFTFTDSSMRPLYQEYRIDSNGSVLKLKASYSSTRIECTVDSGGGPTKRTVEIPEGISLVQDGTAPTQGKSLRVGDKQVLHYLNPLTLQLEKSEVSVEANEKVALGGKPYSAQRVSVSTPLGRMTFWQTAKGDMIRGELPFGMSIVAEAAAVAKAMDTKPASFVRAGAKATATTAYVPPTDFALATAIRTDKPINEPREVRSLTLVLRGVEDRALLISDNRQTIETDRPEKDAHTITIVTERLGSKDIRSNDGGPAKYAGSAAYLEIESPAIRAVAKEIRDQESDPAKLVAAIADWVHAKMTPDYTIGVPRSCTEIIGRRRGVCRDYATLFAGIARAAGVPTRVVGGIVYAQGKFFYHAWAESWLGYWLAVDPTMGSGPVDATHVKFAHGDVTDMFKVVGVVGRLRVEVRDVE